MKQALTTCAVLALSASLVITGCASNTQKENTIAGAAGGGVIGGVIGGVSATGAAPIVGGVIVGALIGGLIGHSMDSSDAGTTYKTMDNNVANKGTRWVNPNTGTVYEIVPTSPRMTINGNDDCRKYRATAIKHGKKRHFYGTACRQADGTWVEMKMTRR